MTSRRELRAVIRRKCRSPESLQTYERIIFREIGHPLTQRRVKAWWDRISTNGLGPSSLRLRAAVCRSVLSALAEDGDKQTASALRWFRRSITLPMVNVSVVGKDLPTPDEWNRLYTALPERAALALRTIRYSGVRISTLLQIGRTVEDAKAQVLELRGKWYIRTLTKRERLIELGIPKELAAELHATPTPWFPFSRQSFHMLLRRTALRVLGRPIAPHTLRRLFITRYYEASGGDLAATARAAAHASSQTTLRYITVDEDRHRETLRTL